LGIEETRRRNERRKRPLRKAKIIKLAGELLDGKIASLKIHKKDESIQEERTSPRSAGPKKTKG
jgi:hypothetical protein